MSSKEYKKYEKTIAYGELANKEEIDFICEDSNFVICKNGDKKINPDSEFRTYLRLLFSQKERNKLKTSLILLK